MPSTHRPVPTQAEAAARYAAAGWPVLPLYDTTSGHCCCRAGADCAQPGRHPRTRHGHHDATTALPRVKAWWTRWPHANLGVPTGQSSGLVVVDLDGPDGLATWHHLLQEHPGPADTATAVTPHGRHLWYRLPVGVLVPRRIRGLGAGIDVLGDGGYAVAAPSRASCGQQQRHGGGDCDGRYTWTTVRIAPLPEWVAAVTPRHLQPRGDRVSAAFSAASTDATGGRTYGQAALRSEVDRVASAPRGRRNHTLNLAAYHLGSLVRAGELDRPEAEQALVHAAEACGLVADDGPAASWATIASGLDGGLSRPRTRRSRPFLR